MARKALIEKQKRKPKFKTRRLVQGQAVDVRFNSRCQRCGRSRAYLRKFGICRICFRELALGGMIPGVRKASW